MLSKIKKITLTGIVIFLAVILIAYIIWQPGKIVNKLPNEKIVSIVKEYQRMPGDTQKWQQVEPEQDKIAEFEEELNSIWYVKRISFQKDYKMASPRYVITYENYTVTFWRYRLIITPNEDEENTQDEAIHVLFSNRTYEQLKDLFLD